MTTLHPDLFETLDAEQSAYLAGYLAAGRTKTILLTRPAQQLLSTLALSKPPNKKRFTLSEALQRQLGSLPLSWAFLRGAFDRQGAINPNLNDDLWCTLRLPTEELCAKAKAFCVIPCTQEKQTLRWTGVNALDLLGKLYQDATIALPKPKALYWRWASRVSGLPGKPPTFRWSRLLPEAVPPAKARVSDSGYDVTLIRKVQTNGFFEMYGAGIQIEPAYGWYFDLAPRSSIAKTGYLLANSFGVIDRAYRGELLVVLYKIDPNAPPLSLPCRLVQLIPRPIIHARLEEVPISMTERGEGGFGSTGR